MNKFIGELEDGSGKLYETEHGQSFILSSDGSTIRMVFGGKELSEYKNNLKKKIQEHFANPYCSKTDIGNVMYEKEIMELIDRN